MYDEDGDPLPVAGRVTAGYISPGVQARRVRPNGGITWVPCLDRPALLPRGPAGIFGGAPSAGGAGRQGGRLARGEPGGDTPVAPGPPPDDPFPAAVQGGATEIAEPMVSLIIPVYNAAPTLRESIDSALAQTYDNLEIIVVDDGSTDATPDIIAGYGSRVRTIRKRNGGVSSALNAGIRAMSGEWYAHLAGDDILYPRAIERLAGAAARLDTSLRVIPASAMRIVHADGSSRVWFYDCNHMSTFEQGVRHIDHFVGGMSFLVPRTAYEVCGPYNEDLMHEDWEFFLRLVVVNKYRLLHIPALTHEYRESAGSLSSRDPRQKQLERKMVLESVLASLPSDQRARYLEGIRQFRRKRRFVEGVYDRVNLDPARPRAIRGKGGGGGVSALRAAGASLARRHPFLYGAYRALRGRSLCYALGWVWAARNGSSRLAQRCRSQPRYKINEMTEGGPVRVLGLRFFSYL